jgi:hypothetical protein
MDLIVLVIPAPKNSEAPAPTQFSTAQQMSQAVPRRLSLSVMRKALARDDPPTWNDPDPAAWRENSDQMMRVAKLALNPKKSIERKKAPGWEAPPGAVGRQPHREVRMVVAASWATAANGGKPQSAG